MAYGVMDSIIFRHYKIFCVNGNTRLIFESRISIYTKYFIVPFFAK